MKKILVVDDDTDILYVVDLILTHHKFIVQTTSTWSIISKTIENFNPDLILMDIDLEGADGCEICQKLKQSKKTQHIPIILFSVHTMPDKYVKECNAQGFITKPFQPADFVDTIKNNLNYQLQV